MHVSIYVAYLSTRRTYIISAHKPPHTYTCITPTSSTPPCCSIRGVARIQHLLYKPHSTKHSRTSKVTQHTITMNYYPSPSATPPQYRNSSSAQSHHTNSSFGSSSSNTSPTQAISSTSYSQHRYSNNHDHEHEHQHHNNRNTSEEAEEPLSQSEREKRRNKADYAVEISRMMGKQLVAVLNKDRRRKSGSHEGSEGSEGSERRGSDS